MLLRSCVPSAICSHGPLFLRSCVAEDVCSRSLCSQSPMSLRLDVPMVLCSPFLHYVPSQGPLLTRSYVPQVLCSQGRMFTTLESWLSDRNTICANLNWPGKHSTLRTLLRSHLYNNANEQLLVIFVVTFIHLSFTMWLEPVSLTFWPYWQENAYKPVQPTSKYKHKTCKSRGDTQHQLLGQ